MLSNFNSYLWAQRTLQDTASTLLQQELAKRIIKEYLLSHTEYNEYTEV